MNQGKKTTSLLSKIGFWMLILCGISVVSYIGMRTLEVQEDRMKIAELEKQINDMRSALDADSVRQFNIQKIITIIDQYNVEMPVHQKYEIAEEIFRMANKYSNINVDLICATITHESAGTWDPEVVSPAGAMGLMQIMPTTGMFVATFENLVWSSPEEILFDPIYNIRIGSRYLSTLIDLYDIDGGLAAYNGGERRAALWLGNGKANGILARETQEYVPAVTKLYAEFQQFQL
jgi:soluble lytic murein transglycosylase